MTSLANRSGSSMRGERADHGRHRVADEDRRRAGRARGRSRARRRRSRRSEAYLRRVVGRRGRSRPRRRGRTARPGSRSSNRGRDEPPHVLVAAEPVGEHHRLAVGARDRALLRARAVTPATLTTPSFSDSAGVPTGHVGDQVAAGVVEDGHRAAGAEGGADQVGCDPARSFDVQARERSAASARRGRRSRSPAGRRRRRSR